MRLSVDEGKHPLGSGSSRRLLYFTLLWVVISLGCSIGSREVSFSGVVSKEAQTGILLRSGGNVTVCSLGECSVSSEQGDWGFVVAGDHFPGGDILFTVNASGVESTVAVRNIRPDVSQVVIRFVGREDGSVVPVLVLQDGVITNRTLSPVSPETEHRF